MKRSRLRNIFLKHRTYNNKKCTAPKEVSVKNTRKTLRNLILKILILKKLLIAEVSERLPNHYLPKIHQLVKKLTSLLMEKPYPVTRSSMRHLNIPKPKSFPLANENLDPGMSVIKSFDKRPSIIKIKTKALD